MLKAIGWTLKIAAFTALVLVLGHWIRWDGKTISDQVRTQLSHAERSQVVHRVKDWTGDLVNGARKKADEITSSSVSAVKRATSDSEHIPPSEREKLRSLIRELNR